MYWQQICAFFLLGFVVFGYGWWNANLNLSVNLRWWLLLALAGAGLMIYSVNVLLDRTHNGLCVTQEPQITPGIGGAYGYSRTAPPWVFPDTFTEGIALK